MVCMVFRSWSTVIALCVCRDGADFREQSWFSFTLYRERAWGGERFAYRACVMAIWRLTMHSLTRDLAWRFGFRISSGSNESGM